MKKFKFTFFRSGCVSTVYFEACTYTQAYAKAERYCKENGYNYFAV